MKQNHNDNSLTLDNLKRQRNARSSDFGLLKKILALPPSQDASYGIGDHTRSAFVSMLTALETTQVVLTRKQRAWAHRLIHGMSKRVAHDRKTASTGERSPVKPNSEAARAMRKIDRWLDRRRGAEPAQVPTGDRSPVAPVLKRAPRRIQTQAAREATREQA